MSTDRELLELAAKAAGFNVRLVLVNGDLDIGLAHAAWNPLADDGDALRLAVKLHLTIDHYTLTKEVCVHPPYEDTNIGHAWYEDDAEAATRLAIVRAAAEIGRSM